MNKPITDAILTFDQELRKFYPTNLGITIQLPYGLRQVIIMENETMYNNIRGVDKFTLYGSITIEPTKDETEHKLRAKIEQAKKQLEQAQAAYDNIMGGTNG